MATAGDGGGSIRIPAGFKLSVVIPAYNELASIRDCLARVAASPVPKEIIIVDDGSTDDTAAVLQERKRQAGDRLNVLKMKPPMCLTRESADFFVDMLDRVLSTGW